MYRHLIQPCCVVLGTVALLLAGFVGAAQGDTYEEIQKEIGQATKALQENRPDDTLNHLTAAVKLLGSYKPGAKDYMYEAYLWKQAGERTAALKAVENALAKNEKCAEAYYLRGYYARLLGNEVSAHKDLRKALDLNAEYDDPADKNWYFLAARELWSLFEDTREYRLAEREFGQLVTQDPKNSQFFFYLGTAQLTLTSYKRAADSLLKALDLRPDDAEAHEKCTQALEESVGAKAAIECYEKMLHTHPGPDAELWLGILYLKDGQKEKAASCLVNARNGKLGPNAAFLLAKYLSQTDHHKEAAEQYGRLTKEFSRDLTESSRIDVTIGYGKELVRAGKVEDGLHVLDEALAMHRMYFPKMQQPLDILFELAKGYHLLKQKGKAEVYFRQYLDELLEGAQRNRRKSDDVEIAESLGDLYLEDQEYKKAAEVFGKALMIIDFAVDKDKCPTGRVQLKYLQALHGQDDWDKCIPAAKMLLADKKYGPQARHILAHAYLETNQPGDAIEQLVLLKGTSAWDDDALQLMSQALLGTERPEDALKYSEEAYRKQPEEQKRALNYAQALAALNRVDEARELYRKIVDRGQQGGNRNVDALIGLGELEMQLAKGLSGQERVAHLSKAKDYFKEARSLRPSAPRILARLSQAEGELAMAEAEQQLHSSRIRWILYTLGLLLAASVPVGLLWFVLRRQWALRCFRNVCDLERDLMQCIRGRVQTCWAGDWTRLSEDPFRGRFDYKALRNRADKEGTRDILGVATFGQLVAIVDAGWDVLGFKELCKQEEMVNPKEVIIANLSYVSSCRACLAHFAKLEELMSRRMSGGLPSDSLKGHLSKHLHRQVRTSLQIIRAKFNLTPQPAPPVDLPVLAPVAEGSEQVRSGPPDIRLGS
jgi:tetratricopeptide (TPR) repeat protein